MTLDLAAVSDGLVRDLRARQEEWIAQQAASLGITVKQLAESYYLEYQPMALIRVGTGEDWKFRATQEVRLHPRSKEEST